MSTEAAITALGQHDQLFHRQVIQPINTISESDKFVIANKCHGFMILMTAKFSFVIENNDKNSNHQVLQLRHQQAAQQQLLQQQFQMQRQLLLDSQVPTLSFS